MPSDFSRGPSEALWDRKLRLDHILTWLVTGAATGAVAALLWVQSVDRRLHTVEQEGAYQRERDKKQDDSQREILILLKEETKATREEIKDTRNEIKDLANRIDRRNMR